MKKSYIIIIAICVFVLAVVGGFFGAKRLSEKPEETEAPSTTVEETTEAVTAEKTEIITEIETKTETETESDAETTVPVTEALKSEIISTDYYSITLPASWYGKCDYTVSDKKGNGSYNIVVRHNDSYSADFGGMLFSIALYPVEDEDTKFMIEEQPVPVEYLGVLKVPGVGDFDVIATLPSDAQFSDDTMDDYFELFNSKKKVFDTLTPLNGATFEKAQ